MAQVKTALVTGGSGAVMWTGAGIWGWLAPRRASARLRALAPDLRSLQQRAEARKASAGECHRMKVLLDNLRIRSPRLLPPRAAMPGHNQAEWSDFLARVAVAAEVGDIKMARDAAFRAEFEWHCVDEAMAEMIQERPSRFLGAVRESMREHPQLLAHFFPDEPLQEDTLAQDVEECYLKLRQVCEPDTMNPDYPGNQAYMKSTARDAANPLRRRLEDAGFEPPPKCTSEDASLREWFEFLSEVRDELAWG